MENGKIRLTLTEDTRNKPDKHSIKHHHWAAEGVALIRSKLAFGDYALPPVVSIDTKASIQELASNVFNEHERFRRELVGARDAGCLLVVLTENVHGIASLADLAAWREPAAEFAKRRHAQRRIEGARLAKACATMEMKYGARFEFCAPDESARRIVEILTTEGREHG